ncbi:MAG: PAS domain S-box protein [Patescibacteria group bacterium]|jgi:PAS domain S-box-containing protein
MAKKKFDEEFKSVFEGARDGIVVTDLENKAFHLANKTFCDLLGYTLKEIEKLKIEDIHPKRDLPHVLKQFEKLAKAEINVAQNIPVKRKDETIFYADVSSYPILIDKKHYLLGFFRDVSLQREKQGQLKEKSTLLRAQMETSVEGILAVSEEGKTIMMNKKFGEMWKIPQEILDTKDDKKMLECVMSQLKDPQEFGRKVEYLYKHKDEKSHDEISFLDGRYFDRNSAPLISEDEEYLGRVWFFRDITERKWSEEALKKSERLLLEMTTQIPGIVYQFYARPNGEFGFYYVSSASEKVIGLKPNLDGYFERFIALVFPEYRDGFIGSIQKAVKEKSEWKYEGQMQKPSGEKIWFSGNSIPSLSDHEVVFNGIVQDITERKKMEVSLKESSDLISLYISNSPIYTYIKSVTPTESRVIMASKNFGEMIGAKGKDAAGKTMEELFPTEFAAKITADDNAIISLNKTTKLEEDFNGRNYTTIKFPIQQGDKKLLAGYTIDITDQRIAEQKIKNNLEQINEEKTKVETIINSIGDAVLVIDSDFKILIFNESAVKISGFTKAEAIGQKYDQILKFIYEKDGQVNDVFIKQAMNTGNIQEMANHTQLIRKDGVKVQVADSASPVRNKEGKIIGCVVVFRDVTREREIDQMKSEFVSIASHQLRTPLTGIKWFSEFLLQSKLSTKNKEYIEQINSSNERMIRLVDDLLNVSHIDTGRKFDIVLDQKDIVPIMKNVIKEQISSANQKHITLNCSADAPHELILLIDELKIRQVFQNIISNAIKYSRENTEIIVGCEHKSNEVIFFVKDNGIGIPKHQQDKIFSKFFRADNVSTLHADGTGLGLYIAKAIVEAHHGKIWFESVENQGTTFFISLPI